MTFGPRIEVRNARVGDVRSIRDLVRPLAGNTLTPKDAVAYYEALQQFLVAEDPDAAWTHHWLRSPACDVG